MNEQPHLARDHGLRTAESNETCGPVANT
jgi:hypothetical protein